MGSLNKHFALLALITFTTHYALYVHARSWSRDDWTEVEDVDDSRTNTVPGGFDSNIAPPIYIEFTGAASAPYDRCHPSPALEGFVKFNFDTRITRTAFYLHWSKYVTYINDGTMNFTREYEECAMKCMKVEASARVRDSNVCRNVRVLCCLCAATTSIRRTDIGIYAYY
jgi:hypothetical protein